MRLWQTAAALTPLLHLICSHPWNSRRYCHMCRSSSRYSSWLQSSCNEQEHRLGAHSVLTTSAPGSTHAGGRNPLPRYYCPCRIVCIVCTHPHLYQLNAARYTGASRWSCLLVLFRMEFENTTIPSYEAIATKRKPRLFGTLHRLLRAFSPAERLILVCVESREQLKNLNRQSNRQKNSRHVKRSCHSNEELEENKVIFKRIRIKIAGTARRTSPD